MTNIDQLSMQGRCQGASGAGAASSHQNHEPLQTSSSGILIVVLRVRKVLGGRQNGVCHVAFRDDLPRIPCACFRGLAKGGCSFGDGRVKKEQTQEK
jgi:hypothetical protein